MHYDNYNIFTHTQHLVMDGSGLTVSFEWCGTYPRMPQKFRQDWTLPLHDADVRQAVAQIAVNVESNSKNVVQDVSA